MDSDEDLKIVLEKLVRDDIILELTKGKNGDCEFILGSKSYQTVIGCNDLGFWLISQTEKQKK